MMSVALPHAVLSTLWHMVRVECSSCLRVQIVERQVLKEIAWALSKNKYVQKKGMWEQRAVRSVC
eukprot:4935160-Amphidinium_carterae.2